MKNFTTKDDSLEKVKQQNPVIKEMIEKRSEFSFVFSKEPREENNSRQKFYQVVARVSEGIRKAIRNADNKLYMDLTVHQVVDRFYVKRCNKC